VTAAVLRFWGHATFSVALPSGEHLCIDPFESGAYGGKVALPPLPDVFTHVVCSHQHGDHNAWHTIPSARRVFDGFDDGRIAVRTRSAFHDEHQGRLRGGTTDVLDLRLGGLRIVHCGDLGERPVGALLDFIARPRPDVLIVPVGGHFTLDADGAAELVDAARPRFALPCHSADDGTLFAELGLRSLFTMRFADIRERGELTLDAESTDADDGTAVVVLSRTTVARGR
jgi:L-ascorbate metabolism protein UlaG (beta-lactamase superfamily)